MPPDPSRLGSVGDLHAGAVELGQDPLALLACHLDWVACWVDCPEVRVLVLGGPPERLEVDGGVEVKVRDALGDGQPAALGIAGVDRYVQLPTLVLGRQKAHQSQRVRVGERRCFARVGRWLRRGETAGDHHEHGRETHRTSERARLNRQEPRWSRASSA